VAFTGFVSLVCVWLLKDRTDVHDHA
jgi:hypothetical protein